MINDAFLKEIENLGQEGSKLIHAKRAQWSPRHKCWKIQVQDRWHGGLWDGWDIYNDLKRALPQQEFDQLKIGVYDNGVTVE